MAWVRSRWALDLTEEEPQLGGLLHENTEVLKQQLADYLTTSQSERVKTHYPQIDNKWVVRRGKTMFILGSSGDGKSTFLNSLIYRMAKGGENILYVSLEFSPKEIWEFLAFVHCFHYRKEFYLPSLGVWQRGEAKQDDKVNMEKVIDDIKNRTHVKGVIDVQRFWSLEEIQQHYEAHKESLRYSVVVVDYLGKLNVPPGRPADEINARNSNVSKAVKWTQKEGKFVLISPSQVNREAHKEARKSKEKEKGAYDLDAMYYGSAAQQDTDWRCLCIATMT